MDLWLPSTVIFEHNVLTWKVALNVCCMGLQLKIRLKDGGKSYWRGWKCFFKSQLNTLVEDGDYDASDDNDRYTSYTGMIPCT